MDEILESIENGQRKQAIEQLADSDYTMVDLFEELDKDEIIKMFRVALSVGYLTEL